MSEVIRRRSPALPHQPRRRDGRWSGWGSLTVRRPPARGVKQRPGPAVVDVREGTGAEGSTGSQRVVRRPAR